MLASTVIPRRFVGRLSLVPRSMNPSGTLSFSLASSASLLAESGWLCLLPSL